MQGQYRAGDLRNEHSYLRIVPFSNSDTRGSFLPIGKKWQLTAVRHWTPLAWKGPGGELGMEAQWSELS